MRKVSLLTTSVWVHLCASALLAPEYLPFVRTSNVWLLFVRITMPNCTVWRLRFGSWPLGHSTSGVSGLARTLSKRACPVCLGQWSGSSRLSTRTETAPEADVCESPWGPRRVELSRGAWHEPGVLHRPWLWRSGAIATPSSPLGGGYASWC